MLITSGGVVTVGGGGFLLGVTAGGLSDAFLLGMAGAIAVAAVSAFVGGVKWLLSLDARLDSIRVDLREINLRVSTVESELTTNGGSTVRDAVDRIDRRSRKIAESTGATDYDDEAL